MTDTVVPQAVAAPAAAASAAWPFDARVTRDSWASIRAAGFSGPVPGCVYSGRRLDGGVPLGGLGTGYLTLDGSGRIGHCSIYNEIVPPRAHFQDWLVVGVGNRTLPLSAADISYFGHFPVADLRADLAEFSLGVGVRAFTPFILGDAAASNMPAVLFEVRIENRGPISCEAHLQLSFPEPPEGARGETALMGVGLSVRSQVCGTFDVRLEPGEAQHLRFVFGWHYPLWRDSGRESHIHRYAQRYRDAKAVATAALEGFDRLLMRTLAWQQVIYAADLPRWLRDALVQGLYSLAKNTVWIAKTRRDEWWSPDGWFTHSESHTGCPITETMVCRMHGHFPALFFFPDLERTSLHAFRHFQIADGEVPFSYGVGTSMRDPRYHCQHPLNAGQYAQMVYRLYLRTGDRSLLEDFYPSMRSAIRYQYTLDDDLDGLVNDQPHILPGSNWPANQFYDIWPWQGTSAYVAGTWLATLEVGLAAAEVVDDTEFASECREWLNRGRRAYEDKLWNGSYYRLWNDAEAGVSSDVSLANQLMAQWCVKIADLPDVLPDTEIGQALDSIERLNVAAAGCGIANAATADGERFYSGFADPAHDHAANTFVGESLCAAMTFVYHGRPDLGIRVAQDIYEAIALTWRSPWRQRCLQDSASGEPLWGEDYYSNMAIWALPMALAGDGIAGFCSTGGLVEEIVSHAAVEMERAQ